METLFIKASRLKLRFATARGNITVEDLWSLPLTSNTGKVNLDQLAINAHNAIPTNEKISFVSSVSKGECHDTLRLDILKYIIAVKQEENKFKADAAVRKEEKQKLLTILKQKQDNKLTDLSEEELLKKIEAL